MPGWKSLMVCDPAPGSGADFVGPIDDCDFYDVIELVQVLIHDMVLVSTLVVVGLLSYAGFLLLTSGGDTGAMKKAKDMFYKIVIGYMWILAAWLIVYTITTALQVKDGYTLLGSPGPN